MDMSKYKDNGKKNIIGYSIIDVRHKHGLAKYYEEYVDSTVKSIELIVSKGYECLLMSFCEDEGDLKVIEVIKSRLSKDSLKKVQVYNYKGNIEEAISTIAQLKLFVAARFHANILGLLCDVGILPVIYSSKTSNMLKDINLDNVLVNMDNLDKIYDMNLIEECMSNKVILDDISLNSKMQFKELDKFEKR